MTYPHLLRLLTTLAAATESSSNFFRSCRAVPATMRFAAPDNTPTGMFGRMNHKARIQTLWIATNTYESLFGLRLGFEPVSVSSGQEVEHVRPFLDEAQQRQADDPLRHPRRERGPERRAIALVTLSVHSSGVRQIPIHCHGRYEHVLAAAPAMCSPPHPPRARRRTRQVLTQGRGARAAATAPARVAPGTGAGQGRAAAAEADAASRGRRGAAFNQEMKKLKENLNTRLVSALLHILNRTRATYFTPPCEYRAPIVSASVASSPGASRPRCRVRTRPRPRLSPDLTAVPRKTTPPYRGHRHQPSTYWLCVSSGPRESARPLTTSSQRRS
jgi:hypothetical protein